MQRQLSYFLMVLVYGISFFLCLNNAFAINDKNLWMHQGNLTSDLLQIKQNCPKTLQAPIYCQILFFLLQDMLEQYQKSDYQLEVKKKGANKLTLLISLTEKAQKTSMTLSVDIINVDADKVLSFLHNSPKLVTFVSRSALWFESAYFNNFEIKGKLIINQNLINLLTSMLFSDSAKKLVRLFDINSLRVDVASEDTTHETKRIYMNVEDKSKAKLATTVDLFTTYPLYVLPMLSALNLATIEGKVFENSLDITQIDILFNNNGLLDSVLDSYAPLDKKMARQLISSYIANRAALTYQTHVRDFLSALAVFLKKPDYFNMHIAPKYAFYHTNDYWYYLLKYFNAYYQLKLAESHPQSALGGDNAKALLVAKKEFVKYKLKLKHLYFTNLEVQYSVNGTLVDFI